MFRLDRQRTGQSSESFPAGQLKLVDYDGDGVGDGIDLGARVVASPVIINHRAYIPTINGDLYCINLISGETEWTFSVDESLATPLHYHRGRLYAATQKGNVYVLYTGGRHNDGTSRRGEIAWQIQHGGSQLSSPLVVPGSQMSDGEDRVVFSPGDPYREVRAYLRSDATRNWTYDHGIQFINSSPAYEPSSNAVYVGSEDGRLISLNAETGTKRWTVTNLGGTYRASPAITDSGKVVLFGGQRNFRLWPVLQVADAADGSALASKKWWRKSNLTPGSPALYQDKILLVLNRGFGGSANSTVRYYTYYLQIDGSSINTLWSNNKDYLKKQVPETLSAPSPFIDDAERLWTTVADQIIVRSPSDGSRINSWKTPANDEGDPDAIIASPKASNGRLLVCTYGGKMYVLQTGNQAPSAPSGLSPAGGEAILSNTDVTLSWETASDPEGALAGYDLEANWSGGWPAGQTDLQVSVPAGTTSHTVSADSLPDSGTVRWRVRAEDTKGANSVWASEEFTLQTDTTPPEPPKNFSALPRDESAFLRWKASPSSDVTGYRVRYRKSEEEGAWSSKDFGDVTDGYLNNLENDVWYDLKLHALDGAGNTSTAKEAKVKPVPNIRFSGNPFQTVQGALDAAAAAGGGVVKLSATRFPLSSTLNIPAGVSLEGFGPGLTILEGLGLDPVVLMEAAGTEENPQKISRLTVTGSTSSEGIRVKGSGYMLLKQLVVRDLGGVGVRLKEQVKGTVHNNDLISNLQEGMKTASASVGFHSNIYYKNGSYGLASSGGEVTANYFAVYGNNASTRTYRFRKSDHFNGVEIGSSYVMGRVAFRDESNDNYRIKREAPTVDQGDPDADYSNERGPNGGHVNIGAFGNTRWAAKSSPLKGTPGKVPSHLYEANKEVMNGITRKLQFQADTRDRGIRFSWSVPFPKTLFSAREEPFSFELRHRRVGDKKWKKQRIENVTIQNDSSHNQIFFASGNTNLRGLKNGVRYHAVLYVYYKSGGNRDVVDPAGLLAVPGVSAAGGSSSSGCYVATSAFGSLAAPAVLELRTFRDRWLKKFRFGRRGVRKYYRTAPPVAEAIDESLLMKRLFRRVLK